MSVNRQAARSAATRAKLTRAARSLFARHGYAAVGTEQIVRRAGVTRGALYHQFPTKEDLFRAVYEQVEVELTTRIDRMVSGVGTPFEALHAGTRAFLEACQAPEVQRIVLIDGPSVLGWDAWREVAQEHGLGLMQAVIAGAVSTGEIAPVDVSAMAHLLMGALDEAALMVVRHPDQAETIAATLERILDGLRAG